MGLTVIACRTSENHRPGDATSFERWIESIRELVVRPSVGSRQAATNAPGKSHSRKRYATCGSIRGLDMMMQIAFRAIVIGSREEDRFGNGC